MSLTPPYFVLAAELERAYDHQLATGGQVVTYTPTGQSAFSLTCLPIDPARLEVSNPGQYTVRWAKRSSFTLPPANGDTVQISGVDYEVTEVQSNHVGSLFLVLRKK